MSTIIEMTGRGLRGESAADIARRVYALPSGTTDQEALEAAIDATGSSALADTLAARDATLAAYDAFDDRYLGAKAADPITDNDGGPLIAGALYFNTSANAMKVYQAGVWSLVTAASSADLASSSDAAKGSALVGHRGTTVKTALDRAAARRGIPSLIRGRRFRRTLGAKLGYTTPGAPSSATLSSVSGHPFENSATTILRVGVTDRRKITSLNAAGTGAPNYMTVVCPERHGLAAGDRIRIEGAASTSSSGPNISVNNLPYGVDGGTAIKSPVLQGPLELPQFTRAHTVFDVVDDFTFRIKMTAFYAISESGAGIYWEPLATWWPMSSTVFSWVNPGDNSALPAISGTATTSYPPFGVVSTGAPASAGASAGSVTSKVMAVEFMLHDEVFQLSSVRGRYRVYCNGVAAVNGQIDIDQPSFPGYRSTFTFPGIMPNGGHRIRIECEFVPCNLFGIFTRTRDAISPIPQHVRRPLMLMLGDSFGEPTGAKSWAYGFPALMGERLGWEVIHGSLGSTGVTTNGIYGAGSNYLDRMKVMKAGRIEPDVICVLDSVNDGGSITLEIASAAIARLHKLWPSADIVVLGRVSPNETQPAGSLTSTGNWINACLAAGVPYVDGGIGALGAPVWITAGNKFTYYHGTQATGTANLTGDAVSSITMSNAGAGYDPITGAPAVTFSGGGGSGAAGTAVVAYTVTDIAIINGGRDYTTATLTIGHGASATAIISSGAVVGIAVADAGVLFTAPPSVTLTGGGGSGATATAVLEGGRLIGFTVTNGGSGYATAPAVEIGICATAATATATITGGVITGVTITSGGTLYTDTPICTVTGDGYGAELVPFISGTVTGVTITAGGSGYSSAPTVTIAHPNGNDATHPKNNGHRLLAHRWASGLEALISS